MADAVAESKSKVSSEFEFKTTFFFMSKALRQNCFRFHVHAGDVRKITIDARIILLLIGIY